MKLDSKNRYFSLMLWVFALGVGTLASSYGAILPSQKLPSFDEVKSRDQVSDLIFYDRTGSRIDSIRMDTQVRKLSWVPLAQIAPLAREILILTEDQKFFDHAGVDWMALASTAYHAAKGERARGASTLTMQLVSLIDQRQARKGRRDLKQKWDQVESALLLEKSWSKDQILEAYMNLVPLRGELVGIHAAAQTLFQKEVSALDPIDASLWVAMLPAPNDAFGKIQKRACAFLKHAFANTPDQAQKLCAELQARGQFGLPENPDLSLSRINESYVYSVFSSLSRTEKKQGFVKTSLDLNLQESVYHLAKDTLHGIKDQNVSEIAALVLKNDTGEVLAYLGSVPEYSKSPHVDGVLGRRQAGSTLKPFFYERALKDHQMDLQTTLNDSPEMIQTSNGAFRPDNYDHDFHGKVRISTALASSLNIPAIQVVEKIGEDHAVETLKAFGFKELKPGFQYGASIALGTVDVTLQELTNAYHELWKQTANEKEAQIIARILADSDSRILTFGLNSVLNTPFYTSVKTGTSKDMRDNWCIGFSDRYTVGVWVGNFNGTPMKDVSGVTGAAPLWRKIMDQLHQRQVSVMPKAIAAVKLPEPYDDHLNVKRAALAHIVYPSDEAVLAYDPEIPSEHQKVLFKSEGPRDQAAWFLNGKKVASLSDNFFWPVERGKFRLEVRGQKDEILDSVSFWVK
jgi:penicillin-binding protein 1C